MLRLLRSTDPDSTESGASSGDDDLKALARRDRRAAADALVRRYREPLFHHAAWILKDWEEAVDVAQEVFIKAMREPRFFDPDFKTKAWLYRVTSNLCFNLVRDRRRRSVILETQVRPNTDEDTFQPDSVQHGERQERILAAMDQLSEAHREILMLRYYSDQSYAEISDTLGIKLGTVMSRLSRAKDALLECLRAAGVEPGEAGET
jgi:RNA polymerase sigma-70 factor (ECF subfamily)